MQALLRRSNLLREGLRVLDAGCGFGMVTFFSLEGPSGEEPRLVTPMKPFARSPRFGSGKQFFRHALFCLRNEVMQFRAR